VVGIQPLHTREVILVQLLFVMQQLVHLLLLQEERRLLVQGEPVVLETGEAVELEVTPVTVEMVEPQIVMAVLLPTVEVAAVVQIALGHLKVELLKPALVAVEAVLIYMAQVLVALEELVVHTLQRQVVEMVEAVEEPVVTVQITLPTEVLEA
jgi:hypothetical protein